MQMTKGVEWAVHAATLMAALPEGAGLSAEALATFHGVPPAYMAKQLQALSKAGLVESARGARGGYWLARPPAEISLWDVTESIEGARPAFRCTEIRQNGPCGLARMDCAALCPIAAAFLDAETAWRDRLKAISIADIAVKVAAGSPPERLVSVMGWIAGAAQAR